MRINIIIILNTFDKRFPFILVVKSFMYLKDQHGKLYYRYNYRDEYKLITVSGHGRYSSVQNYLLLIVVKINRNFGNYLVLRFDYNVHRVVAV